MCDISYTVTWNILNTFRRSLELRHLLFILLKPKLLLVNKGNLSLIEAVAEYSVVRVIHNKACNMLLRNVKSF